MIGADSSSCHNQRAQNDGDNMAAFSCAKCAFGCVLSFHSGEQKPAVFVAFYESILTVQYLSVRYISPDPQTETPPPTA